MTRYFTPATFDFLRDLARHHDRNWFARNRDRYERDVRFSKDKRPYKTQVGIQFRHEAGKDAHAPGFHLHLEPDDVFVGLGVWHPDGPALRRLRHALVERPRAWRKVVQDPTFQEHFELAGEMLKRCPRGYDPKHPLAADLRRKDFIAVGPLTESQVVGEGVLELFAERCRAGAPFVRFLCRGLGVPF